MNENKIKIIISLTILFVLSGLIGLVLFFQKPKDDSDEIHDNITDSYYFSEVFDINEFQSVYHCMNVYFEKLNSDGSDLISLLFSNYIKTNNITVRNVNNYVEKKYDFYSYRISEIKKYSNSYFSIYYVVGSYRLENLDEVIEETAVKDIVIFDYINNAYSVLPLLNEQDNFESSINQFQLSSYDEEISLNNQNEIQNISDMTEFNESVYYFSDYIDIMKYHCDQAFSYIGPQTKTKYSRFDDFKVLCNSYQNEFQMPIIKNYLVNNDTSQKSITIIDSYGISYKFLINSVRDYTVEINIK